MEQRLRTDDIELLTPELANFNDDLSPNPENFPKTYKKPHLRIKLWFRRFVLRSGRNYSKVNVESRQMTKRHGWRAGSLVSCIFVGLVLTFNTTFTIYAVKSNPPLEGGVGKLKHGRCDQILSMSTFISVAINIFSTIVVAASNYNMQCLVAPTRSEIDKAHRSKKHLDIGIPSVRNLRWLPTWKIVLWIVLVLSTLPLHLLWNSAIFSVSTLNEYAGIVVKSDFNTTSMDLDCSTEAVTQYQQNAADSSTYLNTQLYATCWLLSQAKAGKLTRLSPSDCIRKYSDKLGTTDYNLIAVSGDDDSVGPSSSFPSNASKSVLAYFESTSYSPELQRWCMSQCSKNWCAPWLGAGNRCAQNNSYWADLMKTDKKIWCDADDWTGESTTFECYKYATNSSSWKPSSIQGSSDWICDTDSVYAGACSDEIVLNKTSGWRILPEHYEIDHCLISEAQFDCELQYSSTIMYAVVLCNALKFLAILLHHVFERDSILATQGDAVASFLKRPDLTSKYNCLFTTHFGTHKFYKPAKNWLGSPESPCIWTNDPKRIEYWYQGCSREHITACGML